MLTKLPGFVRIRGSSFDDFLVDDCVVFQLRGIRGTAVGGEFFRVIIGPEEGCEDARVNPFVSVWSGNMHTPFVRMPC